MRKREHLRAQRTSRRTAFEVVRYAKALRPRWIVVEMSSTCVLEAVPNMARAIASLGYQTRYKVLNAADFGVPRPGDD